MNILTRDQVFDRRNKSITPVDRDKRNLISMISKLDKMDHIAIYKIIQNMDKKIYTLAEKTTMFDLNDVPIVKFWEIYEFVILSLENKSRQTEIDKARQEFQSNDTRFSSFFSKTN